MLARCIAKDDAAKYFAVIDMLFKKLDEWSLPADPIQGFLGLRYSAMSKESVETCLKDQALFDKLEDLVDESGGPTIKISTIGPVGQKEARLRQLSLDRGGWQPIS
jgi:hypothetical protein